MEVLRWIAEQWFNLAQTAGIVGGLLFTAYAIRKDAKARRIGNLIAINQQRHQIWSEFYERPQLARVLATDVELGKEPLSDAEELFVNSLVLHLSMVYRAMKEGLFVQVKGIRNDIKELFSLPIPQVVWEKIRPLQESDFARFVDTCLLEHSAQDI